MRISPRQPTPSGDSRSAFWVSTVEHPTATVTSASGSRPKPISCTVAVAMPSSSSSCSRTRALNVFSPGPVAFSGFATPPGALPRALTETGGAKERSDPGGRRLTARLTVTEIAGNYRAADRVSDDYSNPVTSMNEDAALNPASCEEARS